MKKQKAFLSEGQIYFLLHIIVNFLWMSLFTFMAVNFIIIYFQTYSWIYSLQGMICMLISNMFLLLCKISFNFYYEYDYIYKTVPVKENFIKKFIREISKDSDGIPIV